MVYTRLSVFILLVNAHKRHVFLLNFDLLSFFCGVIVCKKKSADINIDHCESF